MFPPSGEGFTTCTVISLSVLRLLRLQLIQSLHSLHCENVLMFQTRRIFNPTHKCACVYLDVFMHTKIKYLYTVNRFNEYMLSVMQIPILACI